MKVINQHGTERFYIAEGDTVELIRDIPANSVGGGGHSPPFPGMYTYTPSSRDIGNCRDTRELMRHYRFLIGELLRITMPGRSHWVHLAQEVTFKKDGEESGLRDFRGMVIREYERAGWIYRGEVAIETNPQMKAIRTHDNGLLFKTLAHDAAEMHMALNDFALQFRKPGVNPVPIRAGRSERYHNPTGWITDQNWIDWANGTWRRKTPDFPQGIDREYVLNVAAAKGEGDEKHLCLARGTLVLTYNGYTPIEEVTVGDLVLTHEGRWRPVTAKACLGDKAVSTVKAQGVPGLMVTPDHKLWTRIGRTMHPRAIAKRTGPQWVEAADTLGSYLNLKLPPTEESDLTDQEWWIVGRWLADGHIGTRGDYFVSIGKHKVDEFLNAVGDHAGTRGDSTAYQYRLKGLSGPIKRVLARCGRGAGGKVVPGEAVGLPQEQAEALLSGYLSGDGHRDKLGRWHVTSVSRALLLGMALVAQRARGVVASVYAGYEEGTQVIEGREVNCKQAWIMLLSPRNESAMMLDDGAWKKVRSIEDAGEAQVWDISVAEDASFTAEGCVVKNCPLQLDVIKRWVLLGTNPLDFSFRDAHEDLKAIPDDLWQSGATFYTPFLGVGSEVYQAILCGRRGVGSELKPSYYRQAVKNCLRAESEVLSTRTLFDEAELGGMFAGANS